MALDLVGQTGVDNHSDWRGGDGAEMGATRFPIVTPACSMLDWLQNEGRFAPSVAELVANLNEKMVACGMPLYRTMVILRTLHPLFSSEGYSWNADSGKVEMFGSSHQMLSKDVYLASPVRAIFEGSPGIRRRIGDPDCPRDFPILDDLAEKGVTDYLMLPLRFSDGRNYAASWSTRAPDGFSDGQVERLTALMPIFAMALEVRSVHNISRNLLDTYLGHKTGERVLNGAIRRGSVETINAVIWYSDLRGFTAMTDRLPSDVLLDLLNDHFEQIVEPVNQRGGEVLKFMGDGMLAIFPIDELGGEAKAAELALAAAQEALARTAELNKDRDRAMKPLIHFGVVLHLGEVVYGNIGAPDRLDFTVIGPAVNQASRIESDCRHLGQPLLMSSAFAKAVPTTLASMGEHILRGSNDPQELFAPK